MSNSVVGVGQASMRANQLVAVAGFASEGERGEEVATSASRVTSSEQALSRAAQSAGLAAFITNIPKQRYSLPVKVDGLLVASLEQVGGSETSQRTTLLLPITRLAGESKRSGMTSTGLRVLVTGEQALAYPVEGVGLPAPVADLLEQRQRLLVVPKSLLIPAELVAYPTKPDQGVSFAIPVAELA